MGKPKHIPIRTCVACRETDEKRDLLRIVRQPDGSVLYDPKGKLSGRGAYVCAQAECIALAQKRKQLERALKVSGITVAFYQDLTLRAGERGDGTASRTEPTSALAATGAAQRPARETGELKLSGSDSQGQTGAPAPPVTLHESEGENL